MIKEDSMGKLKTAIKLLKLNNKLGLLDAGDILNLASTAYKAKRFNPTDHLPEWEIFEDREYEKAQRRKTILTAAAVAGGTYLLYKNRKAIGEKAEEARYKAEDLASDANYKAHQLADDASSKAKKLASDVNDKAEDVKEDVSDKAHDLAADAADKGEDLAKDVSKKADDASKKLKKGKKEIKKNK